jgi:hypothetical protein
MRPVWIYSKQAHSVTLLRSPVVKSVGGAENTVGRRLLDSRLIKRSIRRIGLDASKPHRSELAQLRHGAGFRL